MAPSKKAIVFLGGGRITSAILAGLKLAKHDYRLIVHDRNPDKLLQLKRRYAVAVESSLERALADFDILVVAVRPGSMGELLGSLQKLSGSEAKESRHAARPLAISLAAGIALRSLSKLAGRFTWARAMPSPVGRFGRGLTAVTFSRELPPRDRKRIKDLFALIGGVVEIPESKFDAFTVTYSSSHGYHALAALADSAHAIGLDRETALLASAHALADGILAWREGEVPLEELLEEAATPGGIAAATLRAMDESGYRKSVRRGVVAGLRRTRQMRAK